LVPYILGTLVVGLAESRAEAIEDIRLVGAQLI